MTRWRGGANSWGFDVEDVEFRPNGSGRMLIRRSKTDQAGEGSVAYLSRTTVRWLQQWLDTAGIQEEAIFRRLVGRGHVSERLHEDSVSDIFKRVAAWIGMSAKQVRRVSGHSVRVGGDHGFKQRKPKDATMRAKCINDAALILRGLIQ